MHSKMLMAALASVAAASALSCSICRCGDPTFNALGKEGVSQSGLRVALDWDQVEKTQGSLEEGHLDSLREQRVTVRLPEGAAPRRVQLLVAGKGVPVDQDGRRLRVTVPSIRDLEVVAVDL